LDDLIGLDWAWIAADADFTPPAPRDRARVVHDPRATYGHRAVLARPDRYIADVVE